ncbi:MAG: acetate--CoA ligase [Rickettsiales bacterium]|nr:acetate--CoA ligase [Rickettsiales bacterium]
MDVKHVGRELFPEQLDEQKYQELYNQSIENPEEFWADMGKRLDWFEPFSKVKNTSFEDDITIKWYEDGVLNVAYNCLDRHLDEHGDKVAFIFEGDEPSISYNVTYRQAHEKVCRLANVLKDRGVKKGDRVTIYMPMVVEACYAMLACARIGAVHSVVFGGFSPKALRDRIIDCQSDFVITADEGKRGSKSVPLKVNVDEALKECPDVRHVLVLRHTGGDVEMVDDRDLDMAMEMKDASPECEAEPMKAEDPLFILYTSGSTGKPKGVLHTTGGYLTYASLTHKAVFNYQPGDIYWCTADVGWITGHSYIVYGPLANCATTLVFEGVPNFPDYSRFWHVVDKHNVTLFYTAPTAIRALMRAGDDFVKKTERSSLRLLGSVGEPINPEAWHWYHDVVGEGRCEIVDTWWQTETGGIMITPLVGTNTQKAGWATKPFFGIKPKLVDNEGNPVQEPKAGEEPVEGNLVITDSWPGQMRTVYRDHERFKQTYFSTFKGTYFTGDGARMDADGNFQITGRVDDVINVSGHRFGTAEIESALVAHNSVAEAAVVGYPHDLTGQGIYAYVTLKEGMDGDDDLAKTLVKHVRSEIGPIAKIELLQWADGLPKTRSGKIMRRILRKIAANECTNLGDTSTLADPTIVDRLIDQRLNK